MSKEPLRIQADDPDVLARTGEALRLAAGIKHRCSCAVGSAETCWRVSAMYRSMGALFVSSWKVETGNEQRIVVGGRELKDRERRRWLAENYEAIEESGEPIDAPLTHGVTALLCLPPELPRDYPDLVMRCDNGHGDYVANRLETIALLRYVVASGKPASPPIDMNPGEELAYLPPSNMPGPSERATRRITRRYKPPAMPVSEYLAKLNQPDTPRGDSYTA